MRWRVPVAIILAFLGSCTLVSAAGAVEVARDLAAVIALHGKPCGTVVAFEKRARNDYLVDCASGHGYRVFVDPRGRVVVVERASEERMSR